MNELFLKLINMSISASWLILAVLILRLILKKAPKWVNVLLWGMVAIRLICPFSFESALSLIPSAETFPEKVISGPSFHVQTGISPVDSRINDYLGDRYFEGVTVPANNGNHIMTVLTVIWIIGILLLIAYTAISYWRLHRKIDTAIRYKDNIFQSENVTSPFVLGIIKPRIYLPFSMNAQDLEHVVAHEQAHIHRKDHWWKPLGFLLLTIHWFNPLMWVAYVLLCRDIELACDEKVIKELDNARRADYTQALVVCSVNRPMIAACPLAFGEVGVKERVKSVMNYKKPAFWLLCVSAVVCVVVAVCFLTDPLQARDTVPSDHVSFEAQVLEILDGSFLVAPVAGSSESDSADRIIVPVKNMASSPEPQVGDILVIQYNGEILESEPAELGEVFSVRLQPEKPALSLNDVIILSQKGYDLTWTDFDQFQYIETGSGLYIRVYEINDLFSLWIGGGGPDSDPMYIYLALADNIGTRIDIRDGGVTEFISAHNPNYTESWDLIPMVRVDGKLYLDTGKESTAARCGNMDGEITSQVSGSECPSEDGQSNFGTGYGYQYGASEGTIEILMNGKWWIFATEEVRQEIQFPADSDAPADFYLTVGADGVKSIEISMPDSSGGCENADGSPFKKGERIYLEPLDGYADLCGLSITALGEDGTIIWSTSIPEGEENEGFTHLTNDGWIITNIK